MKKFWIALCVLGFVFAGPIFAGAGSPETRPDRITAADVAAGVLFNEMERRVLSDYLRNCRDRFDEDRCWEGDGYGDKPGKKPKSLPPGLEKKVELGGELPPGWQMKIARGEVLDRDFYRTYSRTLPEEILRRLPAGPDGTSMRRINDRILRVDDATRTILDVFYLAGY